jgi:DNA repair exonuclease SbcCD ATPase subunit
MERIERRDQLSFQSKFYILETVADETRLEILLESEDTSKVWRGHYSSAYIEEITQKTGNFKKFPVFLRMLVTALENASESVSIDLLSYDDLERLKSKKKHKTFSKTSAFMATNPKIRAKMYLILTYSVEFDRVHYPLPLVYEDSAEVDYLQKTIHRLQAELHHLKHTKSSDNTDQLIQENETLKHQIIKLEHSLAITTGKFNSDIDKLIREKRVIEEERDRKHADDYKKIKRLKAIRSELERELDRVKREMDKIISQLEKSSEERSDIKNLKAQLEETRLDLDRAQREANRWKEEYARAEEMNKMYEAKITALELDIKIRDSPSMKKPRRAPSPKLSDLPLQSSALSLREKCVTPASEDARIKSPTQENLMSYLQTDSTNRPISWNVSGKLSSFSAMYSEAHSDLYSLSSTESSPNYEFNSDALEARIQKLQEVIQLARA